MNKSEWCIIQYIWVHNAWRWQWYLIMLYVQIRRAIQRLGLVAVRMTFLRSFCGIFENFYFNFDMKPPPKCAKLNSDALLWSKFYGLERFIEQYSEYIAKKVLPDTVLWIALRNCTYNFMRFHFHFQALWTQMYWIIHHSNLFAYPLTTVLYTALI